VYVIGRGSGSSSNPCVALFRQLSLIVSPATTAGYATADADVRCAMIRR
jgi:hypothetical protein